MSEYQPLVVNAAAPDGTCKFSGFNGSDKLLFTMCGFHDYLEQRARQNDIEGSMISAGEVDRDGNVVRWKSRGIGTRTVVTPPELRPGIQAFFKQPEQLQALEHLFAGTFVPEDEKGAIAA